jgi:hypothetical protein
MLKFSKLLIYKNILSIEYCWHRYCIELGASVLTLSPYDPPA